MPSHHALIDLLTNAGYTSDEVKAMTASLGNVEAIRVAADRERLAQTMTPLQAVRCQPQELDDLEADRGADSPRLWHALQST